jgi:hypothetical protein
MFMALKNVLTPYRLVNAESMGADVTSSSFDITYTDNIGIQLIFTGTPTGNFYVQGTIDESNWSNLSFDATPTAAGAGDTHLLNISLAPYKKLRVFYDRTSGTGSLTVYVMAKSIS